MQAEMNRAMELYDQQHQVSKKLTGENQHFQAHLTELSGRLSGTGEQLRTIAAEKDSLQECVRKMEEDMHKKEKLRETVVMMNHQLKIDCQKLVTEKEQILSNLHALEQQRKHDYAAWQADRRDLENAITANSKLSDENNRLKEAEAKFRQQVGNHWHA